MTDPNQLLRVSVIICVLNGASTISRQLKALDQQVGQPRFEVIVVDNGSTDGTQDIVRCWLSEHTGAPSNKKLLIAHERSSIPYARNVGAKAAESGIIAYCDADDRVDAHWVRAIADCLTSEGMLGGRIEAIDPSGTPQPGTFPHGLTQTAYLPHAGNCNLAVTKNVFNQIGGYDETLPRYGFEDVDICWRAQEAGFPLIYCPDAIVYFSISPKAKAVKKEFLIAQGRVAMARRHPQAYQGFTFSSTLAHLLRTTALLPVRLLRPGHTPRSRHIRHFIDACGFFVGYLKYGKPTASRAAEQRSRDI